MANILTTDKFMGYWSISGLEELKISIVPTSSSTAFFGIQELPQSSFSNSVILNSTWADNNDGLSEDDSEARFFFLLSAAQLQDDLAAFLLRLCCFSNRDRFIRLRPKLQFQMLGKTLGVVPNVALVNKYRDVLLLVQEDKVCTFHLFLC